MVHLSNFSGIMDAETISKNGTSVDKGKPCPKCGSTNTDKQNDIWVCWDCHHEFGG